MALECYLFIVRIFGIYIMLRPAKVHHVIDNPKNIAFLIV